MACQVFVNITWHNSCKSRCTACVCHCEERCWAQTPLAPPTQVTCVQRRCENRVVGSALCRQGAYIKCTAGVSVLHTKRILYTLTDSVAIQLCVSVTLTDPVAIWQRIWDVDCLACGQQWAWLPYWLCWLLRSQGHEGVWVTWGERVLRKKEQHFFMHDKMNGGDTHRYSVFFYVITSYV